MFPNERLERYYRLYEKLLDFSDLCWWLIDLDNNPNIYYCNKTMAKIFDLDTNSIKHSVLETCPIAGDYNKNIAIKSSKNAKLVFKEYENLRNGKVNEYVNAFPYYNAKTNKTNYFISRAKVIEKNNLEKPSLLFGIIEPESINNDLFINSSTDALTGLKNRREFDVKLEFLLNLAKREKHPISLIMCDIDDFKLYNDTYGHFEGDQCLAKVAKSILHTCKRQSDVVCRYGGEEFAIIIYGNENISKLAQDIRYQVEKLAIPNISSNNQIITLSVGYCTTIPDEKTNLKDLIEKSDKLLYLAKEKGKNKAVGCS
jgi:diguanylate cyclase (GGDEF)-like protein